MFRRANCGVPDVLPRNPKAGGCAQTMRAARRSHDMALFATALDALVAD